MFVKIQLSFELNSNEKQKRLCHQRNKWHFWWLFEIGFDKMLHFCFQATNRPKSMTRSPWSSSSSTTTRENRPEPRRFREPNIRTRGSNSWRSATTVSLGVASQNGLSIRTEFGREVTILTFSSADNCQVILRTSTLPMTAIWAF